MARLLRSVSGSSSALFDFDAGFLWSSCGFPPGLDRSAHTVGGLEGHRTGVRRGRILLCFHASRFAGVAVLPTPVTAPDTSLQATDDVSDGVYRLL